MQYFYTMKYLVNLSFLLHFLLIDGSKSAKVRRRTTTTTVAPRDMFTFGSGSHSSNSSLMSISIDLLIPSEVTIGSDVVIACNYLSGKPLHSLKWYREGREFYLVQPSSNPVIRVLDEIGIQVDEHNSNDTHVTLKNVTSKTSGVFTCEITDKEYLTHHQEKFMSVIPSTGSGARKLFESSILRLLLLPPHHDHHPLIFIPHLLPPILVSLLVTLITSSRAT